MRLLIAADVDRLFVERVRADSRFDVVQHPVESAEDLAAVIGDAEIVVTRAGNQVSRLVFDAAPRLRLIAQGTSGTDNIDAEAARERGVEIISLPGENANAVAELVLGYMLMMTRTIPFYTSRVVRGVWNRDDCNTRHELRFHRLGLVGYGQVGKRVARLARAFGMTVLAYDPYVSDDCLVPALSDLLTRCDILSLHVPLTADTRRMVSDAEIRAMPAGSYLINAARGEVLDQEAALRALADGHLAGLALDVYSPEPPAAPLPDDPRLVLTPHIAGCTHEAKSSIGEKLYARVVEWMTRA